ncbi:MAG TPA: DHA2 family efflux MFS transporter permease subunit [Casimicrobiaceae bacterium]|nr:DHA2 family efflux MFS transporter permease subunit [Casimicrobiaceae bacterium]
MVGTVATVLSATIVNVAFPALLREFNIGHDSLQWIATGFLAATTTTMLATAWLVDRFGQRRTFLGTMALFLFGSLLGAASWNTEAMIAARVLQGAAAGVMQPLAMIALFSVFPPDQRGRAMGLFGFGVVLAPAIGPALGGALMQMFGWRAIFLLSVPFCVAAWPLGMRALPDAANAATGTRFDALGAALLIGALVTLLDLPVTGRRAGWTAPTTLGHAAAALAFTAAFVARERRTRAPLLALSIFGSRGFRAASIVAFAYGVGLFGTTYLVPVFVQDVAGYSPAQAGNLLFVPGLALAAAIAFAGRLTDRAHARHVVAAGLACFAVSSLLLALATGATGFWILALWLAIGRAGLGLIIPSLNVGAVQALAPEHLGQAASVVNFARQLGGAIGVNLLAVLLEWRLAVYGESAAGTPAFRDCFLVVTIAFAAAVLPALAIRRQVRG